MKTRTLLSVAAFLIIAFGCKKADDKESFSKLTFKLTDAPAVYDMVNIDLLGIQVIINDSIIDLETSAGVYNLLDFVNGKDTLIVDDYVPAGMLSQVRLILGENNSLAVGEDSYDLKTPSAQQSGLKLNVHQQITPGVSYEYIIDFDAARSIVKTGNSKYILKPVIKVFADAVTGGIEGVVFPAGAKPVIYAISETEDTSTVFADTLSGKYMFRGLFEGSYSLEFMPVAPYNDTTLKDISVVNGLFTKLDTLKFE